ncbi:MAG: hypothetical protein ABI381_03845 [Jatrophihabitantaceae bacterium]
MQRQRELADDLTQRLVLGELAVLYQITSDQNAIRLRAQREHPAECVMQPDGRLGAERAELQVRVTQLRQVHAASIIVR